METYITICKIDSQREFAVSGNSNRGSVSTYKGRMGREMGDRFKREGIYVYLWFTWGASLVAQRVKHLPVMREIWV